MTTIPRAPDGLQAAGRRLWLSVVQDYELDEHELALSRGGGALRSTWLTKL